MSKWWLVMGSPRNWRTAFSQGNLWGLKQTQRNLWEHLERDDRLLFYAGTPVSGVIGAGAVQSKFIQNIPLWPEEVRRNEVIWPLRLELRVDYCLPEEKWSDDRVVTEAIRNRAKRRQMLQMVEEDVVREVAAILPQGTVEVAESAVEAARPANLHEQTIRSLLEIGRLQNFIAEKEYEMEGSRLDVVWRRVAKAVPNYVFEVHIGGDMHRDLAKLKHAYDIWNSNIFLVATATDRDAADRLLSGLFHEIKRRLNFIDVVKIAELSDKKRSVVELEQELGIL